MDYTRWMNLGTDLKLSLFPSCYSETRVMKIHSMRHLSALCGQYTRTVKFYPPNFFLKPLYEDYIKEQIKNIIICKKNIKIIKKLEKYLSRAS